MSNKTNTPFKYHAKWQMPQLNDQRNIVGYEECFGILTYDGDKCILEVFRDYRKDAIIKMGEFYDVISGCSGNDKECSLFNVYPLGCDDFIKMTYVADYAIVGKNVSSMNEPVFQKCTIVYPYLRNWAHRRLWVNDGLDVTTINFDFNYHEELFKMDIEEGVTIRLSSTNNLQFQHYEIGYNEDTQFEIVSEKPLSISKFKDIYHKFTNFLSVALYCRQQPNGIVFYTSNCSNEVIPFLFSIQESVAPKKVPLIVFDKYKDRLNIQLSKWYAKYDRVSPIVNSLIKVLDNNSYDTQKFLMVAQALDGYHKRFINKLDGKDIRKYDERIKALTELFGSVETIGRCNIDSEVLRQTRDKYSHLIPDEDPKLQRAVDDKDLCILTKKSIILLTCCILHYIGMSIEDTNDCMESSRIKQLLWNI